MKRYVLFLTMALLAIQFQSCSSGDDDLASSDEFLQSVPPPTVNRAEILDGIQKGQIYGGGDSKPKERKPFYKESIPEVDWVSALGTFSTIDHNGNVEVRDNLGAIVKTEEGATFSMTSKGKGLHIEGSNTTHPQSGYTYHTRMSLDIDDTSLLATNSATITNINVSTDTEYVYNEAVITGSANLIATNIPMISNLTVLTWWKGGTIIDYSYSSGNSTLTLVDNPANFIEVWISFKDGSGAKARLNL